MNQSIDDIRRAVRSPELSRELPPELSHQPGRRACLRLAGAALALGAGAAALPVAAAEPVSTSRFGSVAIGGHDPAAYHALGRSPRADAVEGLKSFEVEYKGATWRFVDADSAAAFKAEPDRYAPAYNGHCANALSLGEGLIRTDGQHWQIFDGDDRLYLFYAERGRDRWMAGEWQTYKQEADAAWRLLSR